MLLDDVLIELADEALERLDRLDAELEEELLWLDAELLLDVLSELLKLVLDELL